VCAAVDIPGPRGIRRPGVGAKEPDPLRGAIQVQAVKLPTSARMQSAGAPAILGFDAYGRRFELELESNDRLLRRLSATRRAELPPRDIYRGKLTGLPGSWVRLTRLPDGI
jgi:hypothetical protein